MEQQSVFVNTHKIQCIFQFWLFLIMSSHNGERLHLMRAHESYVLGYICCIISSYFGYNRGILFNKVLCHIYIYIYMCVYHYCRWTFDISRTYFYHAFSKVWNIACVLLKCNQGAHSDIENTRGIHLKLTQSCLSEATILNDDVMIWQLFRITEPFVWGAHRLPMCSPHKWQVTWNFDVFFIVRLNKELNSIFAGDLRRHNVRVKSLW